MLLVRRAQPVKIPLLISPAAWASRHFLLDGRDIDSDIFEYCNSISYSEVGFYILLHHTSIDVIVLNPLEEVVVDMLVWSRERTPTIYDEFVGELRNNAEVEEIDVEHLIEKAEEFWRT